MQQKKEVRGIRENQNHCTVVCKDADSIQCRTGYSMIRVLETRLSLIAIEFRNYTNTSCDKMTTQSFPDRQYNETSSMINLINEHEMILPYD